MPTYEHWRESHRMTLSEFAEYYGGGYPQAFIIEHIADREGHDLQEGQRGIACHERKVRVLQAKVLLADGRRYPVTIPINLAIQFALLPAQNSERFGGHKMLSVKDIVHAKDGLPKAVQVMEACTNSKKQPVPPNEVLYNVTLINAKFSKRGFTGTSANGVRHTFHEGDSTARFSSRVGDTKAYPVKFFDHITFPQKARVYLSEGKECPVRGLEHLSVVEFTGRQEEHFLAVKTNIDDPESHDCQSVPFDLDILVSAVTLKGYPLEKLTLKDRKMIKQLSAENILQPPGNFYVSKPIDTTIRDEPDPAPLCDPPPPDSRRQSQISLGRSQSSFTVNMDDDPDPATLSTPPPPDSRRQSQISISQSHPFGINMVHIYYNLPPEHTEEASSPHSRRRSVGVKVIPHGCSHGHLEHRLLACAESPEYTYVQIGIPIQGQPRGPPSPPPQHTKPKHHQAPPVKKADSNDEDTYEEMKVVDISTQQRKVQAGWKLPQPEASRSLPPVVPARPDHSPKPRPKGVPDTAIPLSPVPSTRAPQRPRVPNKPIMLTSCPKEPELRYYVAAKLGQDWRSVCTYLGLQHYQLQQADVAHSQLEDKVMEALVMWLKGQGDSKALRSWNTLLQALRWAGQNDMASDVEKHIKNGTLQLTQPTASRACN